MSIRKLTAPVLAVAVALGIYYTYTNVYGLRILGIALLIAAGAGLLLYLWIAANR